MNRTINTPRPRTAARRPARRSGRPWSGADISRLAVMAERHVPVGQIARKLQRSEGSVRAEAARQRVRLGPTDKRPYGGRLF
jgi:hypothetical protein